MFLMVWTSETQTKKLFLWYEPVKDLDSILISRQPVNSQSCIDWNGGQFSITGVAHWLRSCVIKWINNRVWFTQVAHVWYQHIWQTYLGHWHKYRTTNPIPYHKPHIYTQVWKRCLCKTNRTVCYSKPKPGRMKDGHQSTQVWKRCLSTTKPALIIAEYLCFCFRYRSGIEAQGDKLKWIC